jgi:phosphohistidine swiveling domain-containing protein
MANTKTFSELPPEEQAAAGGKGGSLAKLVQAGFPVPDGFVILPAAFEGEALTAEAWTEVRAQLDRLRERDPEIAFAVRSSAMSEDSSQASFAGEFETLLNVRGDDEMWAAIEAVYRSRQNERVQAYSQARGMAAWHEIAVVVQELVRAECAGVMFTAHPVTGQRDRVMISAAWGLGEAVVSGQVTPDTIVVDKASGQVLSRETADKQVMTVLLSHGTEEQPVPEARRHAPVLSDDQAAKLARLGVEIETLYGIPMDVEWVLTTGQAAKGRAASGQAAKGAFAIVQARPITVLPDAAPDEGPELPAPTEWALPEGSYVAMRNNIVELMVEPLTPLFRTLGRAAINASIGRTLTGFFGRSDVVQEETIIAVNEYAYYNGSWSAGQMTRILLSSVGIMRRMFTGAVERWTDEGRPRYVATVERWKAEPWRERTTIEILDGVRVLTEAAIDAYMALVSGVIPAAWISEGLFTAVYNLLVKRRSDPPAPAYLMGYDSVPVRAEKALYDLASWAGEREGLAAHLRKTPAAQIVAWLEESAPEGVDPDAWDAWCERFNAYLAQYGHTIYNLDFGSPVPADDPAPLLETLKMFLGGQGADPHARQQAAAGRREEAVQAALGRLKRLRLRLFRRTLASAQRYAPLREDGLADVGLAYPLLREMLREVGRRLVEGEAIAAADDVYWLTEEQVVGAAADLDRGQAPSDLSDAVREHKAAWRAARKATPPLGLFRMMGKMMVKGETRKGAKGDKDTLKGVAASPGQVTAPACVLHGPEDFHKMKTGDVLVAALTTPAWTPLFARAAAVVTDIGGPLSHGSIVAREYGIPAVLGTGEATRRIENGQVITVDGTAGTIALA